MNDWMLKLYHGLPGPIRSLAATARGYQLRRWRYGANTDDLVEEALERESWTQVQWEIWRQDRLSALLERAATRVPYYRDHWSERRRRGDQSTWGELENWPILEKETLRKHARRFVADDCEPERMFHDHTSGTSGKSLDLWFRRDSVQAWYALFEARWRRWYGLSRNDRWGILGGQLITPIGRIQPPFWVWNHALNQLYLSSYHLSPELIPSYLDEIAKRKLVYLLGYTSSLYALSQVALRRKRRDLNLKLVLTNAEPLDDYQRETIAEAFDCEVRETYGMSETVAAASECEAGRLHLWPEAGLTEIMDGDAALPRGLAGDLICTGFINADMPLIRYRVGDRGSLAAANDPCSCGRTLPQLDSIEGRIDDVLYTADGRSIGRLDPVFKSNLPIQEAQIVQEQLDRIRIRYVPAEDFTPQTARSLIERLQSRMGRVEVLLEPITEIPRGPSGKFRAVICKLPPDVLARLKRTHEIAAATEHAGLHRDQVR
jgi:phenylacetate-CoA ligase